MVSYHLLLSITLQSHFLKDLCWTVSCRKIQFSFNVKTNKEIIPHIPFFNLLFSCDLFWNLLTYLHIEIPFFDVQDLLVNSFLLKGPALQTTAASLLLMKASLWPPSARTTPVPVFEPWSLRSPLSMVAVLSSHALPRAVGTLRSSTCPPSFLTSILTCVLWTSA